MTGTPFERSIYALYQRLFLEGFAQERDRSGIQCTGPVSFLGKRRYENDRRVEPVIPQTDLQIETAHARHLHVRDQARCLSDATGFQELLGGREDSGPVPQRSNEFSYRVPGKSIIIDDRYHKSIPQFHIPRLFVLRAT
jgi:hypothetical protein